MHDPNQNDWNADWNQPQQPAATPHAPATANIDHPLANNSFDFGAFIDALKLSFNRAKDTPILKALIILTTISLAWGLLTGMVATVGHFVGGSGLAGILTLIMAVMGLFLIPLTFIISAAQIALLDPMRKNLFEGPRELGSPVDVIKNTTSKIVPALIGSICTSIVIGIGTIMCVIPGIIAAFLFSQVPYLMVVHNQGLVDAFTASKDRAIRHWHVIIMGVAVMFGVVAVSGMIFGGAAFAVGIMGGFFEPIAHLGSPVINWFFQVIIAVVGFIVSLTAFSQIDELEGLGRVQN